MSKSDLTEMFVGKEIFPDLDILEAKHYFIISLLETELLTKSLSSSALLSSTADSDRLTLASSK